MVFLIVSLRENKQIEIMTQLDRLKRQLKRGKVYRREELAKWSNAVDRHLDQLVADETLNKLSQGLYFYPENTAFGKSAPEEENLVRSFLRGDSRFLLTSPNAYNSLGVGTTQLYNMRVVYNHKRHGEFKLGNREFKFQVKHHFPNKVTPEFLLVDLVNNLEQLAEDRENVLHKALTKASTMEPHKLKFSLREYGSSKTKKLIEPVLKKVLA